MNNMIPVLTGRIRGMSFQNSSRNTQKVSDLSCLWDMRCEKKPIKKYINCCPAKGHGRMDIMYLIIRCFLLTSITSCKPFLPSMIHDLFGNNACHYHVWIGDLMFIHSLYTSKIFSFLVVVEWWWQMLSSPSSNLVAKVNDLLTGSSSNFSQMSVRSFCANFTWQDFWWMWFFRTDIDRIKKNNYFVHLHVHWLIQLVLPVLFTSMYTDWYNWHYLFCSPPCTLTDTIGITYFVHLHVHWLIQLVLPILSPFSVYCM